MAEGKVWRLFSIDWRADPDSVVAQIAAHSDVFQTPCGEGEIIWRRWGNPRSGRTPIVLLHGGSGSWTHWIKIIPALSAQNEVWAADLPGLGDSAMPQPPHTPAAAGQIVADGIRALFLDGRPVHLVGFSFGAHVGTYAAALLGHQIATYTICGCAALGIPHNRLDLAREHPTMSKAERDRVHRINLERLMFSDPAGIDALAMHLHGENIRRARFKSRAFATTGEIPATLPRVVAPLRAIWGADDVLATPSVEARYDILRRHHPELITCTIPAAGHWVAYEQPAAFVKALGEVTGSGGATGASGSDPRV